MPSQLFSLLVGLFAAAALGGCQSTTPVKTAPAPVNVAALPGAAAGLSAEQTQAAKRLYELKCARCHRFYDPAGYPDREWHSWMTKMSRKARLKPNQEELLSRYFDGFRAKSTTP